MKHSRTPEAAETADDEVTIGQYRMDLDGPVSTSDPQGRIRALAAALIDAIGDVPDTGCDVARAEKEAMTRRARDMTEDAAHLALRACEKRDPKKPLRRKDMP